MPRTPRRRLTRHTALPRPTYDALSGRAGDAVLSARQEAEGRRVAQSTARQAPYLAAELRRVAGVTAVCVCLLGVLAIIQRVR